MKMVSSISQSMNVYIEQDFDHDIKYMPKLF